MCSSGLIRVTISTGFRRIRNGFHLQVSTLPSNGCVVCNINTMLFLLRRAIGLLTASLGKPVAHVS